MWIIIGIALFMFLVMIHELGHYLTAKKAGVKVLEFGIGIPPKAFTIYTDKSGTERTLNRIPLGGFVRLKGEDPDAGDFLDKDSFITASVPRKLIILFGGIAVNTLFAWLIFSFAFMYGVKPIMVAPEAATTISSNSYLIPTMSFLEQEWLIDPVDPAPAEILYVEPWSLADEAGILTWSIITRVDDLEIHNQNMSKTLKWYIWNSFELWYTYQDDERQVNITCPDDQCLLGVAITGTEQIIEPIQFSWLQAFAKWRQEIVAQTRMTFNSLGTVIRTGGINKLSGPVCIVKFGDRIIEEEITAQETQIDKNTGIAKFLAFGGLISLALAVFNILPIPALDGGRALWVVIQRLWRMKPEKYFVIENYFNIVFFVLIMWLGIYIIWMDLQRCRSYTPWEAVYAILWLVAVVMGIKFVSDRM